MSPVPALHRAVLTRDAEGMKTICNVFWGMAIYAISMRMITVAQTNELALVDEAVLQDLSSAWPSLSPLLSCSSGSRVGCLGGRVVVLSLDSVQLRGGIPSSIGNLSHLTRLDMNNNYLSGEIPASFANLKNLTYLDLRTNNLTGAIPDFLDNLPLQFVDFSFNYFTSFPNSLWVKHGAGRIMGNCIFNLPGLQNQRTPGDCAFLGQPPAAPSPPSLPQKGVGDNAPSTSSSSSSRFQWWWAFLPTLAIVILAALIIPVLRLWWRHRATRKGKDIQVPEDKPEDLESGWESTYSLSNLRAITDNWSEDNLVGKGGFGSVYRAQVEGTPVAVKRLYLFEEDGPRDATERQLFLNEVRILNQLRHKNLVKLLGYCCQERERILVTDFISNGSLSEHLFKYEKKGFAPLDWATRRKIAIETAEALHYLHALSHQKVQILHRDLKADNILLDESFSPFICDFGIARLFKQITGKTASITLDVVGTRGYMAPEWLLFGKLSNKVDVYSFGVVLLELVTGRPSISTLSLIGHAGVPEELVPLQAAALACTGHPELLSGLIDPNLIRNDVLLVDIIPTLHVAMHCVLYDARKRPSMEMVVHMLQNKLKIPELPRKAYAWSWHEAMRLATPNTSPSRPNESQAA